MLRVGAGIPRPIALITNAGGESPPLRGRTCIRLFFADHEVTDDEVIQA